MAIDGFYGTLCVQEVVAAKIAVYYCGSPDREYLLIASYSDAEHRWFDRQPVYLLGVPVGVAHPSRINQLFSARKAQQRIQSGYQGAHLIFTRNRYTSEIHWSSTYPGLRHPTWISKDKIDVLFSRHFQLALSYGSQFNWHGLKPRNVELLLSNELLPRWGRRCP